MKQLSEYVFLVALLSTVLVCGIGCGDGGGSRVSAAEERAKTQEEVDKVKKRTDIPDAAKAQIIGHLESNLKHDLAPVRSVGARKSDSQKPATNGAEN